MATSTRNRVLSRGDIASLAVFAIVGIASAAWSVITAILRIIEVLPNSNVTVLATFRDTRAVAPIGVNGAEVTVVLEEAVLTVPSLPLASVWSIVIQQVVMAATFVTVVACLLLLVLNVMRGRAFGPSSTRLVSTAGIVAVLGAGAFPFFGNMAANGAFAALSDGTFDNVIMTVDLTTLFAIAFVAALASTVFAVGARLQRDTEGLV